MSVQLIDRLESRRLLSATLSGQNLSIVGTDDTDTLAIVVDPGNAALWRVSINGASSTFNRADVAQIRIFAEDGNDTITVGDATNLMDRPVTIYGGGGDDQLTAHASTAARLRVYLENGNDSASINGSSRDVVYGDNGDDFIGTAGGRDVIFGGDGNDNINAGTGNDRVFGQSGNDTIFGGPDGTPGTAAKDYIDAGDGDDTVNGGNGNDTIFGQSGNDLLYGGEARDYIDGGEDVDTIYGQAGNDTILGGGSNDILFGNAGADRFLQSEFNDDEVEDFQSGFDVLV